MTVFICVRVANKQTEVLEKCRATRKINQKAVQNEKVNKKGFTKIKNENVKV